MNKNSFQVEEHGSGEAVDLPIKLGKEELAGQYFQQLLKAMDPADIWRGSYAGKMTTAGVTTHHIGPKEDPLAQEEIEAPSVSVRRRGAGSREPEKKDENPTQAAAPSSPASPAGRRGRATQKPAPVAENKSPSKSKITDEDLTKAASEAARTIGVNGVMKVLDEFGVSKVNQLEGGSRQEFLDKLNELTR